MYKDNDPSWYVKIKSLVGKEREIVKCADREAALLLARRRASEIYASIEEAGIRAGCRAPLMAEINYLNTELIWVKDYTTGDPRDWGECWEIRVTKYWAGR